MTLLYWIVILAAIKESMPIDFDIRYLLAKQVQKKSYFLILPSFRLQNF